MPSITPLEAKSLICQVIHKTSPIKSLIRQAHLHQLWVTNTAGALYSCQKEYKGEKSDVFWQHLQEEKKRKTVLFKDPSEEHLKGTTDRVK